MAENEKPQTQTAIISLIEEMVKQGESEQAIVQTLTNLGVEPEKAKRLLLLGQADTFALVKSEIAKMVKTETDQLVPQILERTRAESGKQLALDREKLENEIKTKYEKLADIETFKTDIGLQVATAVTAAERADAKSKELDKHITQARADLRELFARTGGGHWKALNKALLVAGVVLGFFAAAFFWAQYQGNGLSVDAVLSSGLVALVAITMMVISSLAV